MNMGNEGDASWKTDAERHGGPSSGKIVIELEAINVAVVSPTIYDPSSSAYGCT